jgi:type I restriction enzyme S subunit
VSDLGFLEKLLDGAEVEWIGLGELEDSGLVKLGRGSVISKNDLADTPGDFPVYSSSASDLGEFGRYGKFMFADERLTWSIDGGGRFFYRSPHRYSVTNVCGWLSVLEHRNLNARYLYHYLSAAWANKIFDYTKKAHPSVIRKEYSIPIPCPDDPEKSLAIQGEIVRILDTFTELTAELTAELAARKKQYNHYRDQLLTFADGSVRWTKFVDVADFRRGTAITNKETTEGNVPVVANGPVPSYSHGEHNREGETVVVARSGAGIGGVQGAPSP